MVLKYEKLDILCYVCWMLGHMETSCDKLFEMTHVRRGGGCGGARWLREEGQPWTALNHTMNVGSNHGNQFTKSLHDINDQASSYGEGSMASTKEGINACDNNVEHLIEIFKNPSLLFPKSKA